MLWRNTVIKIDNNPGLAEKNSKRERFDWFFLGRDFAVRTISVETVQAVYFCFGAKPANS